MAGEPNTNTSSLRPQVFPGVVDVALHELRPRRVVGDGVEVEHVAEVDRHEERVFLTEPFRGVVGERRLGGLARLVEVGAVAGRLVEQHAGADHRALVVAPLRRFDFPVQADVVGVQAVRLGQAGSYPFVGHLGELQVLGVAGQLVQLQGELGRGRVGDGVAFDVFRRVGERDAARAGDPRLGVPAGHLERHDPLGAAEHARDVGQLVHPRELDPDPRVVVVVLRPARARRGRDGAVVGGERARVGPFRSARVVEVQIRFQADEPRMDFMGEGALQARDVRHAHGRRERLGERPQKRERFSLVQPRALDVVGLLHRLERELRAFGVDGQLRLLGRVLGGLLGCGPRAGRRRGARGARATHARRVGEFGGPGDFGGALGARRIGGGGRLGGGRRGRRVWQASRGHEAQQEHAATCLWHGRAIGFGSACHSAGRTVERAI